MVITLFSWWYGTCHRPGQLFAMVMINVHRCHGDCHQGQCQLLSTRFVEPALLVLPGSVLLLAISIQGHFSTPTFIKITPCFLSLPFCPLPFYPTFLPPFLPPPSPLSFSLPPSPYLSVPPSPCPPLSLSLFLSFFLLTFSSSAFFMRVKRPRPLRTSFPLSSTSLSSEVRPTNSVGY